jgi:outer membrane cobalamin receptor
VRFFCARTRSFSRAGFFVPLPFYLVASQLLLACWLSAATALNADADTVRWHGRLVDASGDGPVVGAQVRLRAEGRSDRHAYSDTAGIFRFKGLVPGLWYVGVRALGYEALTDSLAVGVGTELGLWHLVPRPLQIDGMIISARRGDTDKHAPVFVESIPVAARREGGDLGQVLERAAGVNIRRSGGSGGFSTVSIRGSTAEQVQVFLDGISLNRASGGGVDLGGISLGGIESVEVYRGSVPARFGGNSIGGVVHLRSRGLQRRTRFRLETSAASFGGRGLAVSGGGFGSGWEYFGLADWRVSDNSFRFLDDNGTEYNNGDDGWATRRNADFGALRALVKIGRQLATGRLQLHHTFDLNYKGIPGISNNQSLHTRFDTRRDLTEMNFNGAVGSGVYRLQGYFSRQADVYKDLRGEVGIGTQHQRNLTRNLGGRGEINAPLPGGGLLTFFSSGRREVFSPQNLLQTQTPNRSSRRRALTLGGEAEMPLGRRLRFNAGGQGEWLADRFFGAVAGGRIQPGKDKSERMAGYRLGGSLDLGRGWSLRGHRGRYRRPPSFFELFGDRGAVIGNTDLVSETGNNWDLGLAFKGTPPARGGVVLAEAVFYRNRVEDLIRFVQNSQQVSRPHNIGAARLAGIETRWDLRLVAVLRLSGNYVYQKAQNRSPFSFEKGNDLPNAPRHRFDVRVALGYGGHGLHYDLSRESRHFLDRANLRPVPVRTEHGVGGRFDWAAVWNLSWKVRNISNNQVADLWGYPLPGRSYFLALGYEFEGDSL